MVDRLDESQSGNGSSLHKKTGFGSHVTPEKKDIPKSLQGQMKYGKV